MGLARAYGFFVQIIYNTDVYFPANVLFYIKLKQWFSRCLSSVFAPVWCSSKGSAPKISSINISSYKCKRLGRYPTATKSGMQQGRRAHPLCFNTPIILCDFGFS